MSVVNIQRDGIFVDPGGPTYDWSTPVAVTTNPLFNGPAAIHSKYASVSNSRGQAITLSATEVVCIGCYFEPFSLEKRPFRVFAGADHAADSSQIDASILVGYGPASPTGTDDQIDGARFVPIGLGDNLIIVEPEMVGDTYYGRPLAIGLALVANAQLTSGLSVGHLSVQNLASPPPAFAQSVG